VIEDRKARIRIARVPFAMVAWEHEKGMNIPDGIFSKLLEVMRAKAIVIELSQACVEAATGPDGKRCETLESLEAVHQAAIKHKFGGNLS